MTAFSSLPKGPGDCAESPSRLTSAAKPSKPHECWLRRFLPDGKVRRNLVSLVTAHNLRQQSEDFHALEVQSQVDGAARLLIFVSMLARTFCGSAQNSRPGLSTVQHIVQTQSMPCALRLSGFSRNLEKWCGRVDSNHHGIATASPSSWCVCQFRHDRTEGKQVQL
jgi:hypothetical protein